MPTTDTDLLETFAPLRDVEPTEDEIARVLAAADALRSPRSLGRPRRRPARAVAVVAATAALVGVLAALPGGGSTRPRDPHGILQAAGAVAAEQAAPGAYRYTRELWRFVDEVNAGGEHGRVMYEQSSENWTSDAFRGRTVARQGTVTWAAPPSPALQQAERGLGAIVKPYDGDYRYGDGPLARVPFAAIPEDATAAGLLLKAAIRTGRPASSTPRSAAARSRCSRSATSPAASARRCSGCSAPARARARWATSPTRSGATASASRCGCRTSATSCG
jgi:hypothetical protein